MRKWLFIFFYLFSSSEVFSQERLSIDSLCGLTCFDSITELTTWKSYKEYFPDSTVKEDVRFRIWGDGCGLSPTNGQKCFFKYQRQSYFQKGTIQEKEGIYGWITLVDTKMMYQLFVYNEKGKLLFVEKKKVN